MCSKGESEAMATNEHLGLKEETVLELEEDYDDDEEEEEEEEEDINEVEEDDSTMTHCLKGYSRRLPVFEAIRMLPLQEVRDEVLSLGKIAGPIIMTTLLIFSRSVISMLFLGHLGKVELAGGSLALGFSNITGNSILKGLAIGMDPICGQAYGAKRWSVLSQTYQKTLFLLLSVSVPISILWLNMEPIFSRLGQDPEIVKVAQVYMIFSIPELFAQAYLHPLRIFLRTQGLTTPLTIACVCSVILHLPINYVLVTIMNLGVKGVALALAWNTINLNIGLIVYLLISDKSLKPWHGVSFITTFQGWRPLLSLSLPSCIAVCLEWWWYEIMLFFCGWLDNPKANVAAMGILIQTTGLLYTFPFSLSSGMCTRIGQALGARQPSRAQFTSIVGITVATAFGLAAFVFMTAMRSVWGKVYTDEPQILKLVSSTLPILGLCELGNSPQTAACGVLTGTARPKVGAHINLFSFYIVGLPVAIVTTFTLKMGIKGLWFGLLAAQVSCVCLMVYTLVKTDWRHQAKRAEELTLAAGDKNNNDIETSLISSDD